MTIELSDVIQDESNGRFQKIEMFAATNPQGQSFKDCIDRLKQICANYPDSQCILGPDFAPNSLSFAVIDSDENCNKLILNGGLIYHGSNDGYGSGSAPTFSVTLNTKSGWEIHT